jgi:hypothetical protein
MTMIMLACTFSATAKDACSSQVKGYLAGLESAPTLTAINKTQRGKAIKQIDYIKNLQKKLPDCKVVDFIPELKRTKKALTFASEQMNK